MIPFQITFVDLDKSEAAEDAIQKRIEKLSQYYDRIERIEVAVTSPHKQAERYFHIKVHIYIPGNDIFISRDPELNEDHRDIYLAIRDAFNSADRVLKEKIRQMRNYTKGGEKRTTPADVRENF